MQTRYITVSNLLQLPELKKKAFQEKSIFWFSQM